MKNYCSNQKQALKKQFTGKNINQNETLEALDRYLNLLIDPSFQEVNSLFVLSFENDVHRTSY